MKIAVIILTYQRHDGKSPFYLKRALDSVFAQLHQDFKVFVIGDKYDDNEEFLNIVQSYQQDKIYYENLPVAIEREKYKNNSKALWCACGLTAQNRGFDVALSEGFEYMNQLDHDDYWTNDHLSSINDVITETGAEWVCTLSTHVKNLKLPNVVTNEKYIEFIPGPEKQITSSVCMNLVKIPIRSRDVLAETGMPYAADADRWYYCNVFITDNHIKSYFVNKLTCFHNEEGYVQ